MRKGNAALFHPKKLGCILQIPLLILFRSFDFESIEVSRAFQVGAALADVSVPEFQPKQGITIPTAEDGSDAKAASNGVDDQKIIELLTEKLKACLRKKGYILKVQTDTAVPP